MPGTCAIKGEDGIVQVEEGEDYRPPEIGDISECGERVTYVRRCGHEVKDVACKVSFRWASCPEDAPPCRMPVTIPSPICEHEVQVKCHQADDIANTIVWIGKRAEQEAAPEEDDEKDGSDNEHDEEDGSNVEDDDKQNENANICRPKRILVSKGLKDNDNQGSYDCPFVQEEHDVKPKWFSAVAELRCGLTMKYSRKCGHTEDIPCSGIFKAMDSQCHHMLHLICEQCDQEIRVRCKDHVVGKIACNNLVMKKCSTCNINLSKVQCSQEKINCNSNVTTKRDCGHPITWLCGSDKDPRLSINDEPCLQCIHNRWKQALNQVDKKNADSKINIAELIDSLKDRAMRELHDAEVIDRVDIRRDVGTLHQDEQNLRTAYFQMLRNNVDCLKAAYENETAEDMEVIQEPPSLSDSNNLFDIVFVCSRSNLGNKKNFYTSRQFMPKMDIYGNGIHARILNSEAVSQIISELKKQSNREEDTLTIAVAGVLKVKGLKNVPPFRPEPLKLSQKHIQPFRYKKNRSKGRNPHKQEEERNRKNAARQMNIKMALGYDHVEVMQQNSQEQQAKTCSQYQRVFWNPSAIIPLMTLRLRLQETCEICLDQYFSEKGWHCESNHFLCRDCFIENLKQASQVDALSRNIDKEGNVRCPHEECEKFYDPLALLSQKHDATDEELKQPFEMIQKLKMDRYSRKEISKALDDQKQRLQKEFERIQSLQDEEERAMERLKLQITDMMTLRCPNKECGAAFLDFSGCFALTCGLCKINFCAWCIDYYSVGDIHSHVPTCQKSLRRGQFYSDMATFRRAQAIRTKERIIEELKSKDAKLRRKVLQVLNKDLADIDVRIHENDFS